MRNRTALLSALVVAFSGLLAAQIRAASSELRGQVKDVCGRVIPGATVTLGNESRKAFWMNTDGEGRYVFHDIASDDNWILATDAVGFEKERQTVRLKEGARFEQNVRLVPDLTQREELTVSHGDPKVRFQKYSATGTVTDPNGVPVSGATVTFRAAGSAVGIPASDRCTTDELGRYVVWQWLPTSGRWILSVESQGLAPYVQSDIELQPDEPKVIKISLRPQ